MYSGTCLMWSPVGPHVQWNLSNVVTCGTSFPWVDWTVGCTMKIAMCVTSVRCVLQDLIGVTSVDRSHGSGCSYRHLRSTEHVCIRCSLPPLRSYRWTTSPSILTTPWLNVCWTWPHRKKQMGRSVCSDLGQLHFTL